MKKGEGSKGVYICVKREAKERKKEKQEENTLREGGWGGGFQRIREETMEWNGMGWICLALLENHDIVGPNRFK